MHTRSYDNPISREWTELPDSIAISAQAAMVLKIPSSGEPQEIYAKNPQDRFYPASLTKLLTAITALDVASRFGRSLDSMLEMSAGDEAKGTGNNLKVGDSLSLQDAIANMMLPSSNVTANVVARTFGLLLVGGEDTDANPVVRFVHEMNTTAAGLGMSHSAFVNPHGLHAEAQVTTSADMAKLLVAASQCAAITNVWGRTMYGKTIAGPNTRSEYITSSVRMIGDDNVHGGKTGTLRAKTYNLAICSQTTSGSRLALVVLGSSSDRARYADMRLLLSALDKV